MAENNYGISPDQSDESCADGKVDNCTQTERDLSTDAEPILVEEIEFGGIRFGGNEYHDTYRNGNFGLTRGRVHLARAKIWSMAHVFIACTITCLNVVCVLLLSLGGWGWFPCECIYIFMVFSIVCGILALLTSYGGMSFSSEPAKLRRPLFSLLLVRVLALLECILLPPGILSGIWVIVFLTGRTNSSGIIGLCGSLVILMVLDWFTALAWLFHWWRCCVYCQCLKSCCIFEPGEPLAPGVPDPPTGLLHECVYICWMAIFRKSWSLI